MGIICNVEHCYAVLLKFGYKFSTSLTKYMLEVKISICSTVKENLVLYCLKFSVFVVVVIIFCETLLAMENINFANESLAFQNRH